MNDIPDLDSLTPDLQEVSEIWVYTLFFQFYKVDVLEGTAMDFEVIEKAIQPVVDKLCQSLVGSTADDGTIDVDMYVHKTPKDDGTEVQTLELICPSLLDLDDDQQRFMAMEFIQAIGVFLPTTIFKSRRLTENFQPARVTKLTDYLELKKLAKTA